MIETKLLAVTPDAEHLIYQAARQCYNKGYIGNEDPKSYTYEQICKLLDHVYDSGHRSVLEHPVATFAISGISRACSHQLVRHRIAAYSQQSQRYAGLGKNEFVIPKTISNNPVALSRFNNLMVATKSCYDFMINEGIPAEDARMVLPNATTTNIVMTMNFRSWLHFFDERLCTCAQWEIRAMATQMKKTLFQNCPVVFKHAGPKCYGLGYCPEAENRTCGLRPLKSAVFEAWEEKNGK